MNELDEQFNRAIRRDDLRDRNLMISQTKTQLVHTALCALYRRPRVEFGDYAEEYAMFEVARRPDVERELAEIRTFQSRLPARDRRFFPNSMYKLLTGWQEVLDRARMYEPDRSDRNGRPVYDGAEAARRSLAAMSKKMMGEGAV